MNDIMDNRDIEITRKCIREGTQREGDSCPIAIACKQEGIENIQVNIGSIWIGPNDNSERTHQLKTDFFVSNWIDIFDAINDGVPFTLNLNFEQKTAKRIVEGEE